MPTLTPQDLEQEEREGAEDLKQDLGMLSCFAAAEIDRLIRGERNQSLEYVRLLKAKIESWIPKVEQEGSRSLADSNTMVAIAMALPDMKEDRRLKEVVLEAKEMTERLGDVLSPREKLGLIQEESLLRAAMEFCLGLSRSLRSIGYPPDMHAYVTRRSERATQKEE